MPKGSLRLHGSEITFYGQEEQTCERCLHELAANTVALPGWCPGPKSAKAFRCEVCADGNKICTVVSAAPL